MGFIENLCEYKSYYMIIILYYVLNHSKSEDESIVLTLETLIYEEMVIKKTSTGLNQGKYF